MEAHAETAEMPQHMRALALADERRFAAAALKRRIRSGDVSVAEALWRPDAGCLKAWQILAAQMNWGRARAGKLLASVGIRYAGQNRRVRDLTERQKRAIADATER